MCNVTLLVTCLFLSEFWPCCLRWLDVRVVFRGLLIGWQLLWGLGNTVVSSSATVWQHWPGPYWPWISHFTMSFVLLPSSKAFFQWSSSAAAIISARRTPLLMLLSVVLRSVMFFCCGFWFVYFFFLSPLVFEVQQRSLSALRVACLLSEYAVCNSCMAKLYSQASVKFIIWLYNCARSQFHLRNVV